MTLEKIQENIGYLKNEHSYELEVSRLATILAILNAYQKGVQGKFLEVQDLGVSNDYIEQNLKRLPEPFHKTVSYVLSDIEYCHKEATETLKDFYYFNQN